MYVLFHTFYKFNHVFLMIKEEYYMVLIRYCKKNHAIFLLNHKKNMIELIESME